MDLSNQYLTVCIICYALMVSGSGKALRVTCGQSTGWAVPICKYTVYTQDQNASSDVEIPHQLYD